MRRMRTTAVTLVLMLWASFPLAPSRRPATPPPQRTWKAPVTPDGQPDLQGVWVNNTITPFERPPELADKEFLSDDDMQVLKQRAARLFSGNGDIATGDELFLTLLRNPDKFTRPQGATGDYNQFWMDDGLVFENRTSQIVDPRDGRLPPLTVEGARKIADAARESREHPADGPESRLTQERCLTFGTAHVGWLMARNNSFYQIIQTRSHVVLYGELIHEARVIPLDTRPRLAQGIRFWNGDARGHWNGTTLVIDTTNFSSQTPFRVAREVPVTGEHVHLIERLTPVDADTLNYQVTVDDPTTWTVPWTAVTTWKRSANQMFEYACHEANYSLVGILRGARAEEAAAGRLRR
jgi:hypothetical protein